METLASPLNLEVSINGVQNENSAEGSTAGACITQGRPCNPGNTLQSNCCKGLFCCIWCPKVICLPPTKIKEITGFEHEVFKTVD